MSVKQSKPEEAGRSLETFSTSETIELIYQIYWQISQNNKHSIGDAPPRAVPKNWRRFGLRDDAPNPPAIDKATMKTIHGVRDLIYRSACNGDLDLVRYMHKEGTDVAIVKEHIPVATETWIGGLIIKHVKRDSCESHPKLISDIIVKPDTVKGMGNRLAYDLLYTAYSHLSDINETGNKGYIMLSLKNTSPEAMAIVTAIRKKIYEDVRQGKFEGSYSLGTSKYAREASKHFPNRSVKVTPDMIPYYVFKAPKLE